MPSAQEINKSVRTFSRIVLSDARISTAIFGIAVFGTAICSTAAFAGSVLRLRAGTVTMGQLEVQPHNNSLLSAPLQTNHHFILQFRHPLTISQQRALSAQKIQLLRYVPEDAYIVRANEAQLANLKASDKNVRGFAIYQAAFKMSPDFAPLSIFNKDAMAEVNVYLLDSQSQVTAELKTIGAQIVDVSKRVIVVRIARSQIPKIGDIDGVEWVSERHNMELFDFNFPTRRKTPAPAPAPAPVTGDFSSLSGYESGTRIMGFSAAVNAGLEGQGQIVGVGDTGLDTGDMSTIAADFQGAVQDAIPLGMASTSWADPMGHGTHVSGSIVGRGVLSNGLVHGGAVQAKIVMESMWSATYKSLTPPSDLETLFQQAYDDGARIHSDSWGDPDAKGVYDDSSAQVDQFVWDHPDMVILIAAGNDGVDADGDGRVDAGSVSSPSTAKDIISVGASKNYVLSGGIQRRAGDVCTADKKCSWPAEPLASSSFSDNPEGLAPFSSRGPTADGRIKPDIVAPGTNILSNCSHVPGASTLWGQFNQDYCYSGGTSMATPLTAGAAAVVRQYLEQTVSSPSAALVKAVMLHTAHDMFPGQFGAIGKDHGQEILTPAPNIDEGFGRVDLASTLSTKLQLVDEKIGVGTGESKTYNAPADTRKVTLVYTDYPGTPTAATALVNTLDIEVQVGNQVLQSNDEVDNAKQIVIPTSALNGGNTIKIVVTGTNVPMGRNGRQPFALVYSSLN